jgi:hypothetical protein
MGGEHGQPFRAGVGVTADLNAGGSPRPEQRAGLRRHCPVLARAAEGSVVRAAVAEEGEGAAEEVLGTLDDLGEGEGPALGDGFEGRGEVGLVGGVDVLDDDFGESDTAAAPGVRRPGSMVSRRPAG